MPRSCNRRSAPTTTGSFPGTRCSLFLSRRPLVIPGRGRATRRYVFSQRSTIGANNVEDFPHALEKRRFTVRSRWRPLLKGHDLRFIRPQADLPTSAGTKHTSFGGPSVQLLYQTVCSYPNTLIPGGII